MNQVSELNKKLKMQSRKIKQVNEQAYTFFKAYHKQEKEADFYKVVQPFVNEGMNEFNVWRELAEQWIEIKRPRYFHVSQTEHLGEHLQNVVVTCFQSKTNKKNYIERYKSIDYTLTELLSNLEESTDD